MRKNAFTLVELLIVIMIIGILATMAVPQYQKMVDKAKWTECVSMLGQIKNACNLYYAEYSEWPNATTGPTYINGSKSDEFPVPSAFKQYVEIPEPRTDGRFVYALYKKDTDGRITNYGLAHGFWDMGIQDGQVNSPPTGDEGYIAIKADGTLWCESPAPKF